MFATATTVFWMDKSRTAMQHHNAAQLAQAMLSEANTLLAHFAEHGDLACGNDDLIHLNAHLLQTRFIREVGVIDAQKRLLCSTALGVLTEPVKGNYPVITSRTGLEILVDVPLEMTGKGLSASIIQHESFNVVLSPYATNDIFSSADSVWLRTEAKPVLLKSVAHAPAIPALRTRVRDTETRSVRVQGLGYELITPVPDTDLVLQSRRSLAEIMKRSGSMLTAMLVGSMIIAILAVGALAPYVIRLCGIQHRIRYLCDDRHIVLVYQPFFDLQTMRPVGCEVLARIREGERLLMPDQLIPALLRSGQTRRFDHLVTQKAIREVSSRLPVQTAGFKLALNYFPDSIDRNTLLPVLQDALRKADRHDLQVCLEVTEHSLSSELIEEVRGLKAQGFLIAIDDFGTGYSNLKSVTRLSPDILKIDKSFIFDLEDDTIRSSLIPEIVNIAAAVGAHTVAEGIENPEQVRLLAAQNVRYGQGYALARPMPIEQLPAFLQREEAARDEAGQRGAEQPEPG